MVHSFWRSRHPHAATIETSPTVLHEAADRNDAETIDRLLKDGDADPNSRVECANCDEGATALHFAAQKGHLEAALALLNGGARPGGRDPPGPDRPLNGNDTPVAGSSSDEWDISDSEISDHSGELNDLTPLHLACAGGHTAVVIALLSAGERTDRIASGRKGCALELVLHSSNVPAADHFGEVGTGAVPHFLDGEGERDGGQTPLHLASACGAVGAVRALVKAGACVHHGAGDCDDTPLHLASASGHVETMAALLEAGADVNAGDEIGNTPLHVARDADTLEFLLAHGANPNLVAMSRYGSGTPLGSYCTLIHRLETDEKGMQNATAKVEALLRYGANVNIRSTTSYDDRGNDELPPPSRRPAAVAAAASPILSCAAKNGVPGIVSALLRAGLDPNERDRDGWAPIHDAAKGNHVDVLRVLLRAGVERDAPTRRGQWTPLHLACRYTNVECVVELLRWNASLGPTARPIATAEDGNSCLRRSNKEAKSMVGAFEEDSGEEEEEEEGENGYGKTPAEVIGLKNVAAAATGPAGNGGSGLSADPSLDEEEEQMVVLGDDDGESGDRVAGVGERNAIRRLLRRETAWRKRRSLVLCKVHLEKQGQLKEAAPNAQAPWTAAGGGVGISLPNDGFGSSDGFRLATDGGQCKRKGSKFDDASMRPPAAKVGKTSAAAGGGGGLDGGRLLQMVVQGLVDLAGREEALFREIVMFL